MHRCDEPGRSATCPRKDDPELRALAVLALNVDVPAVAGDDLVRDCQTQAGAFADGLGRKEGVKYVGQVLRLDTAAVVANVDHYVRTVRRHGKSNHASFAALGALDRLERIDEQIQEDLADLGGHAAELRLAVVVYLHVDVEPPKPAAKDFESAFNQVRDTRFMHLRAIG